MIVIGLILVDVLGRCWTRASGDERHVIGVREGAGIYNCGVCGKTTTEVSVCGTDGPRSTQ